jgi:hypothetical protein
MPLPDLTSLRGAAAKESAERRRLAAAQLASARSTAQAQAPALRAYLESCARDGINRNKSAGRLDFRFGPVKFIFSKQDPDYVAGVEVREAVVRAFVAESRRAGYQVSAKKVDFETGYLELLFDQSLERGTAWDLTIRWKV